MSYQKFPNSKQLAAELKANKLGNVYLFLGEEEGEKDKLIEKIIGLAGTGSDEENYSVRRFHVESGEFPDAVEFALSGSMFSERKICVILNVNLLKVKSGDRNLLAETLDSIPDTNILIMTSPENKLPGVIDAKIQKYIKIYQFWRMFDSDILGYLMSTVRKNGMEIDRKTADYLLQLTGKDIRKVDDAVSMLVDSGEKFITPQIVGLYIRDSKEITNFEFIDSLFQQDKNSFSRLLKVLESGTHELVLLKMIFKQAETIEKYVELLGSGYNSETALQQIGISPRNHKNFTSSAKRYDTESIKRIFPLIYKAEKRVKSTNFSNSILSNPVFELVTEMLFKSL